ncbi:cysteine desulfurase family protein [Ornithinibacillus halotolerans]|uniref:Aminotransferase V n=1 Tax=Ornithinibacillus halotolerans TaxID=1274357 RepID=A0A916S393_9BACI|nr:cysteine desulfurase family protein [Ornithinibacillus halotolerans]GGA82249.1 aminotransferase V [Ornithinibacillus halotolerans]
MIYLDNSATTKPHPEVLKSFEQVSTNFFANPSSIHQLGGDTEKLLIKSKQQIANLLQVKDDEIIFTSGGTEGNNIAIKGIALQHQGRGKHIITTEIEHPSVFEACKSLESLGFQVTYLPVNRDGIVSVEDVESAITNETILISVMHVNNEIGTIQPVKEIGELAKKHPKLFFHVDHVQGLGKLDLQLNDSGIDLCTMSGHKIHGLKGTGVLYCRSGVKLFPLFHGGEQEFKVRSGTENLAGAVSFVKALRLIKERQKNQVQQLQALSQYLRQELKKIDEIMINTPENAAPHIVNFSIPGLKPEVMIHTLGKQGIFISTKSACSSKDLDESRIVKACGYDSTRSKSALRVSLSYDNTMEEIRIFVSKLKEALNQLKDVME